MKVIDAESQMWFLLEQDGAFYLEAFCDHSFVGYSYMIALNAEELAAYEHGGHAYISKLADDIHNSAPIVQGSMSRFKGRDVSTTYGGEVSLAIEEWHASRDAAGKAT